MTTLNALRNAGARFGDLVAIQGLGAGVGARPGGVCAAFAASHGARPMIERFPLARANAALETMKKGTVQFRAVLETGI